MRLPAGNDTLRAMGSSAGRNRRYGFLARTLALGAVLCLLAGCGNYMKLDGGITRVRVAPTGGAKTVVAVEFEATNNARAGYVFREARVVVELNGETLTGDTVAARDVPNLCQHLEALQPGCADALVTRSVIPSGQTVKHTIIASFDKTTEELQNRKSLKLFIVELDRLETEFAEARR